MAKTKFFSQNAIKLSLLCCFCMTAALFTGCNKTNDEPQHDSEYHLIALDDTLVFHGNETLKLHLTAIGDKLCNFELVDYPRWLNPYYYYGYMGCIVPGDTVAVELNSYFDNDIQGPQEGQIVIDSDYGHLTVPVVGWPLPFTHYLVTDTLYFPLSIEQQSLVIENLGNTAINFSITSSTNHIVPVLTQGEIAAGTKSEIMVTIDRNALQLGNYPNELYVDINGQISRVVVWVEKKQLLSSNIVDAAYSKVADLLVYVGTDLSLTIYHPGNRTSQSMVLPFVPTCLTLSTDGTHALVGHDGHVSYIDLASLSVVCCPNISCNANSIVLGPNQWAYVMPKRDQWVNIHNIDLNHPDQPEILSKHLIYAGAKAILSPSGKVLYCAINGLSSDGISTYDIQNDTAVFVTETSYSHLHPVGGRLWLSDGDSRIITRLRTIFNVIEDGNPNLVYQGSVIYNPNQSSQPSLVWIDHSSQAHRFYVIFASDHVWDECNRPYIYVNSSDNFAPLYSIQLEDFTTFSTSGSMIRHTPNPKFVFANAQGDEIYVLANALDGQETSQWGLETLFVE